MLINFALERMGSEISSDKVSTDGYEAWNLLKGKSWGRHKGFMAEGFIKPPVTITLHLPCPVNLYCIILDPQVGSQRSSRLEIYAAYITKNCSRAKFSFSREKEQSFVQKKTSCSTDCEKNKEEPILVRIGNVTCMQQGPVCFLNPRFYAEHTATTVDDTGPDISAISNRIELRHHQWQALSAAQHVAVRVTGTVNGNAVAIGRLEVWGCPARSCPTFVREDMWQRYSGSQLGLDQRLVVNRIETRKSCSTSSTTTQVLGEKCIISNSLNDTTISNYESGEKFSKTHIDEKMSPETEGSAGLVSESDQLDIPEEYLDTLTCEIMTVPMLLPSGQNVDLSTLERFEDVEATYGRRPSDPFTGLTFTAARRPLLNTVLKVRIDRFLSRHSCHPSLAQVPRVLGHGSQCSIVAMSKDINTQDRHASPRKRKDAHLDCFTKTIWQSMHKTDIQHDVPAASKKCRLDCSRTSLGSQDHSIGSINKVEPVSGKGSEKSSSRLGGSSMLISQSHADRLSSSLSMSLTSVLHGLPSFISQKVDSDQAASQFESLNRKCVSCNCSLNIEGTATYLLTCSHRVCRNCLTQLMENSHVTCPSCSHRCPKADVVRSHV